MRGEEPPVVGRDIDESMIIDRSTQGYIDRECLPFCRDLPQGEKEKMPRDGVVIGFQGIHLLMPSDDDMTMMMVL